MALDEIDKVFEALNRIIKELQNIIIEKNKLIEHLERQLGKTKGAN